MPVLSYSIRTILGITIIFMGVVGLVLALGTGILYRDITIDSQRISLANLVELKTGELLKNLSEKSRDLGLSLQSHLPFRTAHKNKDAKELKNQLQNQFSQYFVTAGVIKLSKLIVFDLDYNIVAEATDEGATLPKSATGCPSLIKRASERQGVLRVKVISDLCVFNDRPYYSTIVPIGGLHVLGYLSIVADPSHSLIDTEVALGMPLKITLPNGDRVYSSSEWPHNDSNSHAIIVSYHLKTSDDEEALVLSIAHDISPLMQKLRDTSVFVMAAAIAVTLFAIILVFIALQKTTIKPLEILAQQLNLVREDKSHLGEKITVGGTSEIKKLEDIFNDMSFELNALYTTLEQLAFKDQLTSLPNRNLFNTRLEHFIHIAQATNKSFALFLMDLDRFKDVNDALGHHAGDAILQDVSKRLSGEMRDSDMLSRLMDESLSEGDDDMIARLGGDEFAAILPTVGSIDDAKTIAEKLLHVMEKPYVTENREFYIGISIGIAIYPKHGNNGNSLLRHADEAMYEAKKSKSGFAFYASKL